MRHFKVTDSDVIDAIGFSDNRTNQPAPTGTLEVVFKSSPDDVYRYEGVSAAVFGALVSADSIGKAFHELFRKTKHPFTKSRREAPTLNK